MDRVLGNRQTKWIYPYHFMPNFCHQSKMKLGRSGLSNIKGFKINSLPNEFVETQMKRYEHVNIKRSDSFIFWQRNIMMCVAFAVSQNGLRIQYYTMQFVLDCAIRRLRSKTGVKAYDFRKEPLSELQWPMQNYIFRLPKKS